MTAGRAHVVATIAFCMAVVTTNAKEPGGACSPGIVGGPDALVVAVVVDRTSWRDTPFNAGVEATVAASIRPNTRLVLWRFGGKAQPLPQLVMDVTTERPPDERADISGLTEKMFNKIGHGERMRRCALDRLDAQRKTLIRALRAELTSFDASSKGFSPIALALSLALQPFAAEAERGLVRALLVSDGYEFASASFYPDKNGRYLTPREAVARTRAVRGSWRGAKITIAGIGVTSGSADIAGASALLEIWRVIILNRGAIPVQLTTGAPQWVQD